MPDYEKVYAERIRNYCGYSGYQFEVNYVKATFSKEVYNNLYDVNGTVSLIDEFSSIDNTGFDADFLIEVFSLEGEAALLNSWRIGETFSRLFLKKEYDAKFYHHEIRDTKNIRSNISGADLTGFMKIDQETIFLFGEVKTSGDRRSPPQIMYHPTGMINQLENLAHHKETRNNVIRYLAFRVKEWDDGSAFRTDFKNALVNYSQNRFHLIGVLVRDTEPDDRDLKTRFNSLRNIIIDEINTELLAFYIPVPMRQWENLVAGGGVFDVN